MLQIKWFIALVGELTGSFCVLGGLVDLRYHLKLNFLQVQFCVQIFHVKLQIIIKNLNRLLFGHSLFVL